MKYENFDGPVEELVLMKIREIEEKENIRVLHVIESGSRAWGFASPDSDYDVRFIYFRPEDEYLRLEKTRDVIEWQLDDVLERAQRQRRQARGAVEHRQEHGVQADVHQHDDEQARQHDLPQAALRPVKHHAVDDAAQQRGEREAREVRPGRLEQEAQDVAERALQPGGHRAKEHRRGGEGQMRQRDLEAVVDLNDPVGGEHHLDGQQDADRGERARAAQAGGGIPELAADKGEPRNDGTQKNHLLKPHPRRMIRRDDILVKETVGAGEIPRREASLLRPMLFPCMST